MPAYLIEFATVQGPQRRRFTLDDDRPLRGQLEHVLAELVREGVVVRGHAADELAVWWDGREVDAARTPAALGLVPARPIELRMQRRRAAVPVAVAPEPPVEAFTPASLYASACWGLLGAVGAWALPLPLADRVAWLAQDGHRDVLAAVAWGALVGAGVALGAARRTERPTAPAAAAGALAGALGAALPALLLVALAPAPATVAAAAAVRALLWIGVGAATAAGVALVVPAAGAGGAGRQAGRAAAGGAASGLAAALVAALPGEPALWQAVAPAVAGAGAGAAVAYAAVRRAVAVLALEWRGEHAPGVAALREWALADGSVAAVRDVAPGGEPGAVQVAFAAGRARASSGGAGGAGGIARDLRHEDRLQVGGSVYRFRRRPA